MKTILVLAILGDMLMSSVFGVQVYIKVGGEYIAVPGDFTISQNPGSHLVRNRVSYSTFD